jgi:hypothetical protein
MLLEYGANPLASHEETTMVELARRQNSNAVFSLVQKAVADLPLPVMLSSSRMSDWVKAKRSMRTRTSKLQGAQQQQQPLRQQQQQQQFQA